MNQSEANQKDEGFYTVDLQEIKTFSNFPRLRLIRNMGIHSKYVQSKSVSQKHILRLEQKFIFPQLVLFLKINFCSHVKL